MNRCFKVVFNRVRGCLVVANEFTRIKSKGKSVVSLTALAAVSLLLLGHSGWASAGYTAGGALSASGSGSVAVGDGAMATKDYAVAMGYNAMSAGLGAIALGGSQASGEHSVALGYGSSAQALYAVAIGGGSAILKNSIALGYDSQATGEGSIAIGYSSAASEANTVSFGSSSLQRRLVQIARGTANTDAVNVGQMKDYATDLTAGKNIEISLTTDATKGQQYTVKLSDNITLADNGSLKVGASTLNASGLTLADSGTLKFGSNSVLTKSNLNLGNTGTITTGTLNATTVKTGASTLNTSGLTVGTNVATKSVLADGSLKIGSATLNGTSLSFGNNTPSLSSNGLAMASEKITGLANGTLDTDAVNLSQLNAAKDAATTKLARSGTNINVTSEDNADGSKTYTANLNDTINLTEAGSVNISSGAVLNKDGLKVGSAKFNSAGIEFGTGSAAANYLYSDAFKIGNLTLDVNGLNLASGSLVAGGHTLGTEGLTLGEGSSLKIGQVTLSEGGLNLKKDSRITGLSRADASGQAVEYGQFVEALEASGKTVVVSRAAPDGNLKEHSWAEETTGTKYKDFSLANQVKLKSEMQEGAEVSASLEILSPDGTQSYAKLDKDGLRVGDALSITGSSVGFTGGPALRYGSEDQVGLDMAGKKIANVQDGVDDGDAVNVRQMNANATKLVGSTNVKVVEDQSYEGPGKQYTVDLGNRVTFGTDNSALTIDSRGLKIGSAATFSKDEISVNSTVNGSAVIKGGSIQVSQGDSRVSIDTAQIQLGSTTISSGSIKMGGNNGLQLRSDGTIGRGRSTLQFNPETSTVAFSNQRLTGLLAGTGSDDAATVGQLERLYNHLVDKGVLQEESQTAARTATLAKTRAASGANSGGEENTSVNTLALEDGNIVGQQTVKGLTGGANLHSAPASAVNEAATLDSGSSDTGAGITARAADYTAGTNIAINNNAISLADDIEVKSVKADSVKTKTIEASEKITVGTADNAVVIEPSRIYFSSQGPSISKSGIDAGGNRITGVADGVAPTDAVNVRQMNQVSGHLASRINDVDKRAKAGIAQAIATAGLPQAYRPGAGMASAALGTFGGQGAIAIGVSKISDNGHWVFKGTFSGNTQSKVGGSVGVGYQW